MDNNVVIQTLIMFAIINRRTRHNNILAKISERAQYARIINNNYIITDYERLHN